MSATQYCLYCLRIKGQPIGCEYCRAGVIGGTPPDDGDLYTLPAGTVIDGKYLLGRALGRGGFGVTYLGVDMQLDMRVAIKEHMPRELAGRRNDGVTVVPLSRGDAPAFRLTLERFAEEGRALARLSNHPNVVQVVAFVETHGTAYLVMRYLDGQTVEELCQAKGPLPVVEAAEIAVSVLDGLAAVHRAGLVHRDIKPANIFVTPDGLVKLLDFGSARDAMRRQAHTITRLWTEGYAPPEQEQTGGEMGPWSDVYAAGATLYRMLVGKRPPDALSDRMAPNTPVALIGPHEATQGRVPRAVSDVVMKALCLRAADRYGSAEDFRKALIHSLNEAALDVGAEDQPLRRKLGKVAPPPAPPPNETRTSQPRAPNGGGSLGRSMAVLGGVGGTIGVLGLMCLMCGTGWVGLGWMTDQAACNDVRGDPSVAAWEGYLEEYPNGWCAEEAQVATSPIEVGCGSGAQTIGAALRQTIPGSQLHVCGGRYEEQLILTQDVTIQGSGKHPGDVVLAGGEGSAVTVKGTPVSEIHLRNLLLEGNGTAPALDISTGKTRISEVEVEGSVTVQKEAVLEANRLRIEGGSGDGVLVLGSATLEDPSIGRRSGHGLWVLGSATVKGGVLYDNERSGLFADGGTALVEGTEVRGNQWVGLGAAVGRLEVRQAKVTKSKNAGVFGYDKATVTLIDCIIEFNALAGAEFAESTATITGGSFRSNSRSSGIFLRDGSTGTVSAVDVAANENGGVAVSGSIAELTDVKVHDNEGGGVRVYEEGTLRVVRSEFVDNSSYGLSASDSTLTMTGTSVQRNGVVGLQLLGETTSTIEDVAISDHSHDGVVVSGCKAFTMNGGSIKDSGDDGLQLDCAGTVDGVTFESNSYGLNVSSDGSGMVRGCSFVDNRRNTYGLVAKVTLSGNGGL